MFSDINECDRKTDNCDGATETCVNTKGNFTCNCKPGYEKDGDVCAGKQ